MASAPETIFPSKFGGFGKVEGLPKEEKRWLKGISFTSRSPPNLNPSMRIFAVSGITDHQSLAVSNREGWVSSDFYLFHHLLRGVDANQSWLTSENPKGLIENMAHTRMKILEERKEFLSKNLLPDVTDVDNIGSSGEKNFARGLSHH